MCRPSETCQLRADGSTTCGPTKYQRAALLKSARLMRAGATAELEAHRAKLLQDLPPGTRTKSGLDRDHAIKSRTQARTRPEVIHDGKYGSPAVRVSPKKTHIRDSERLARHLADRQLREGAPVDTTDAPRVDTNFTESRPKSVAPPTEHLVVPLTEQGNPVLKVMDVSGASHSPDEHIVVPLTPRQMSVKVDYRTMSYTEPA
jgi:hypothetical protein